jgi:hypothetical protein
MLVMFQNLFHRANRCPCACFLKVLLSVIIIYAIHIAIAHQINVSPYSFVMLLAFVGVIAALAAASDWNCRIRNVDTKDKLTN